MLPIFNLSEMDEDHKNLSYFAAIVSMAQVEGAITESQKKVLSGLADKLKINACHFAEIVGDPMKYSMEPFDSVPDRLPFFYDLFQMVYADHEIDEAEEKVIHSYAIGLGFSSSHASRVISWSMQAFRRGIESEDYIRSLKEELLN